MTDVYANWAELSAANVEWVDYHLEMREYAGNMSCIAIHGGGIEPGTTEAATSVAGMTQSTYYSMVATKASGNSALHITSTNFDEPNALRIQAGKNYTLSFHGYLGTTGVKEISMGGLDTVTMGIISTALTNAGFNVITASQELNGNDPTNITNRNHRNMGVQIEISNAQRAAFFSGGDLSAANRNTGIRTEEFYTFVTAISSAVNSLNGSGNQTSNYRLNEPIASSSMADFETWINANVTKIKNIPTAPPITTLALPQSGPYDISDRVYHYPTSSIYILIIKDTNWGWHWRPIHAAISPWVTVPSAVMDTVLPWTSNPSFVAPDTANPWQIAFDNAGNCFWRGMIGVTSGVIPLNQNVPFALTLPRGLNPKKRFRPMLGFEGLHITPGTTSAAFQGCHLELYNGQRPFVRAYGGTGGFTHVHFDGFSYPSGDKGFS